ncbi:MAG: DUF2147 domain-containing protein [Bacteroidales bacterium]
MKFKLVVFSLFLTFTMSILAQNADKIIGYYLTVDEKTGAEKSQVQISKSQNGTYIGKIVWLKEPNRNGAPKLDDYNTEKNLRSRPLLGLPLIRDFVYNAGDNEWKDGSIYNPSNGKIYHCIIKFEGNNKLKVTGYVGAAWMGLNKTATWTKEAALRK